MSESLLTKKAIADGLKKITLEKPFDKISISDIANECNINRQTFYYHFQDKYALLSWIYYEEVLKPNLEDLSFENWDQRLCNAYTVMRNEKQFYINTVKHAEIYISEFMMDTAENLFKEAITIIDENNKTSEEDRRFYAKFFAYGLTGMTVEWIEGGMKAEPADMASHMKKMLESSKKAAYMKYLEANVQ